MDQLFVRLTARPEIVEWAVLDADGLVVRSAELGTLHDVSEAAEGRRLVVLVPAEDVISTEAALPKVSLVKQRRMLPFSLEDALAEDVENLSFAVGPRLPSGALAAAVVAHAAIEEWLDRLAAAGLVPQAVYSEADGVPDTPETLTLVIEGERVLGRRGGRPPFAFDDLPLDDLVAVVDPERTGNAIVAYIDEAAQSRYGAELSLLADRVEHCQVKLLADGVLHRLASTLCTRPGTNLLQGPYAPKSNTAALLRPWRTAAALLAGLVLVSFVAEAAEYLSLRRQDAVLTQVLEGECRETLSAATLSGCESAARMRLSQSGLLEDQGQGFLAAIATVAEARQPGSRIDALSYRNRVMDLQLVVRDVPSLDAFARDVEATGQYEVRIQSANPADEGTEGRVQLVEVSP